MAQWTKNTINKIIRKKKFEAEEKHNFLPFQKWLTNQFMHVEKIFKIAT